ncbi:hypothetical protein [Flavobacterium sp. LC2016-23]|uniref:hypothetical protein n=1 Tax=Flavobacterium sp. LC2016-23 TaxID=2666330 RepID=UPI0018A1F81F|nr:hypothetical protein [Flavobacterium sp. LC2016-23]
MNINFLLKQSTKKVFIFILIIPIIIQFFLINLVQSFSCERLYYLIFAFFAFLYLPYFYWLNIVVNFLYSYSNKYFNLKLFTFKLCLVVNIIVVFNFVFFIAYIFSFVFKGGEPNDDIFLYVGLIQFVGVLSFSYCGYFVSKLISTIELKKTVCFNDIAGNLVTFSFPPVALWIIHNKIKKIQVTEKLDDTFK